MRPRIPMPAGTVKRMIQLLAQAQELGEHKRVQCILLRARDPMKAFQVAQATGYHVGTVRRIQHEFLHQGEKALKLKTRGGRRRENMQLKEEESFLRSFEKKARRGHLLEVRQIQAAYEEKVKRPVHPSTLYRLLHRHQWRKIMPRPNHPKNDPEAMATFKKTPGHTGWSPAQG